MTRRTYYIRSFENIRIIARWRGTITADILDVSDGILLETAQAAVFGISILSDCPEAWVADEEYDGRSADFGCAVVQVCGRSADPFVDVND